LEHRPITGLDDAMGLRPEGGAAQTLWQAHRRQLFDRIRNLKIRWPDINLAARDPYAIRILILILVIASAIYAGTNAPQRLTAAFDTMRAQGVWTARADAWIKPPPYTGEEARALPLGPHAQASAPVRVPEGSELTVRLHDGAGSAEVRTGPLKSSVMDPQAVEFRDAGTGASEARIVVDRDMTVMLKMAGQQVGLWRIEAKKDAPPSIEFRSPPAVMQSQTLRFHYAVKDEFGVKEAFARVTLQKPPEGQAPADAVFAFELPLPPQPARAGESTLFKDLTAHRWAGQPVFVSLTARDGKGQRYETAPIKMTLPERVFRQPLARALIEQRKELVRDPNAKDYVAAVLDALSVAPELFSPETSVYLGLRAAHYRLRYARPGDDLRSAEDLLWSLALRVEDGAAADAQAELRRIQQQLAKALSEGASDAEIAQLMQQLRAAMQNYLQSMRDKGQKAPAPAQMGARELSPQDLKAMMDKIETLARSGSAEAAQQMLQQLQSLMESLSTGQAQGSPQEQAAQGAMAALKQIMQQQRSLMDKTFREQSQPAGGAARTQQLERGQSLASEQDRLTQALNAMRSQLEQSGANTQPLQNAQNAMRAAAQNLREGAFGDAQSQQAKAVEALKRSGEALMQAMQAMAAQRGGTGAGDGMGVGDNQDPFGRNGPSFGPQTGGGVKVPTKVDIQRAREIMEELQRRAGDRSRPDAELDYLERLLRRF
jgi:uncharacterized protein (TIGR02302 family)